MALPLRPNRNHGIVAFTLGGADPGTPATTNMNSAYTYGSAGAAVAYQFILEADGTLTDFHFLVSAINGTGSADGNINWELRSGFGAANYKPGSTLVSSGTIAVSGLAANTWASVTGLSVSLSAGVWYHLIFADADGGAINYVVLVRHNLTGAYVAGALTPNNTVTADGWATAGTASGNPPFVAIKVGGVVYGGAIAHTASNFTNNTTARGIKFTLPAGYPRMRLISILCPVFSVLGSWTFKIFKGDGTLPNTTPYYSWAIPSTVDYSNTQFQSSSSIVVGIPDPPLITPGETWYFVFVPDANSTVPVKYDLRTSPPQDIKDTLFGANGVSMKAVQETAGPAWTEYDHTVYVRFGFIPEVSPTIAG